MTKHRKRTHEVFGVSNQILVDSYVDRGSLDEYIARRLERSIHIALRGESKCGKSWLRQKSMPTAITVQCRLGKSVTDLYVDALSQLDIKFTVEEKSETSLKGSVQAKGELGSNLLAKLGITAQIEGSSANDKTVSPAGHDVNDLRFLADIIKASNRRLVIEDFHYMSVKERRAFAFDLKALWDYGVFVIIIGVWSQSNMLIYLNPDLSGRIEEVSIYWSDADLEKIMVKGGTALNLIFSEQVKKRIIEDCFGNAGLLQSLVLNTLDEMEIQEAPDKPLYIDSLDKIGDAEMAYAEQLNPLYQQFAKRVSSGIRNRADSTGIYAHAMAVILEAPDAKLMSGLSLDEIYTIANGRQDRIQRGNLRQVLEKFEELQVDPEGRGLVLSYNEATSEITVVDRQILLYRKYATVKWPWEDLISQADASGEGFEGEANS